MATATKRKTSLTLDAAALDAAKELHINVSAVAEEALKKAINSAKHKRWLEENAAVFAAQAEWHQRNGHPLAEIRAIRLFERWMFCWRGFSWRGNPLMQTQQRLNPFFAVCPVFVFV